MMARAIALGRGVQGTTSPNPWVGAVVVPPGSADGGGGSGRCSGGVRTYEGATAPPGGPHAEIVALDAARRDGCSDGATLYVTLEPCVHHGRTGPCVDAIVEAGLARVVIGTLDPDTKVAGRGADALRRAGIEVGVGVEEAAVQASLAPYLKHRRTGRPWVVLKMAATLDGRTAAADGTSRWITGPAARADVHRLRALSDAVLVGAGTVKIDDPDLRVRTDPAPRRQPLRVVLGRAPESAKIHPALELSGDLDEVLAELGRRDVLQVLVEGGPRVASAFHLRGLVDAYVVYLAPALSGGDDGPGVFAGAGARSVGDLWRGKLVSVERLGDDLKVELVPR